MMLNKRTTEIAENFFPIYNRLYINLTAGNICSADIIIFSHICDTCTETCLYSCHCDSPGTNSVKPIYPSKTESMLRVN